MNRLLFLSALFVPAIGFALTIAPANLYSDVRSSSPEAAGIHMLSREGIVKGYGNGFFGVSRQINRAEFLKIAMIASGMPASSSGQDCFPDVRRTHWFSPFVCAAKDRGIVKGINDGLFHPEYTVTYGEALKMLTLLFEYDMVPVSGHWAESYYRAAAANAVDLPMTIDLDTPLTRGVSARLAAAFLAESKGQLQELRLAESGQYTAGTSSSMSSPHSSSVSSSNSSVSSSSLPTDSRSDTEIRSQFLLLGEVGPVIGAGKIFIQEEPVLVTEILVSLTAENPSVQSLLVYDDDKHLLGRATLDTSASTNRTYKVVLPSNVFRVAQRDERKIYVRADAKSFGAGGQSNQLVQMSAIVIKANGEWSSHPYTVVSSGTETFPQFLTARSMFTSIQNAGASTEALLTGTNRIGSFTFTGRKTDASAHLDLTDLSFDIGQTGGVTVSSPTLGVDGVPDRFPCLVIGTQIVCSTVPDLYGSVTDGPRTLTVYATVSATDPTHASLRLSLNETGSATTAGAVSWTDGTSSFDWIPLNSPIADGTYYRY